MIFSLIADADGTGASGGLSTGAVVALVVCGIFVLAIAVFGSVLKGRDESKKPTKSDRKERKTRVEKVSETVEAPSEHVAVAEDTHDYFAELTDEEKELIRKHRNQSK